MQPEMSEKFDIVLSKLIKAKQEMGAVIKDSTNPFHKSSYASLNAYIEASEEHLSNNGLILVQAGNGSYIEPMIIATLIHPESGQWIKSYLPILNPKHDSQGLGAAVTYMRRYSIATLLGLVAEDDDGETACGRGKNDQQSKQKSKEPDNSAINLQKLVAKVSPLDPSSVQEYVKVASNHYKWSEEECVKKLLEDKEIIDKFNKWKSKKAAA